MDVLGKLSMENHVSLPIAIQLQSLLRISDILQKDLLSFATAEKHVDILLAHYPFMRVSFFALLIWLTPRLLFWRKPDPVFWLNLLDESQQFRLVLGLCGFIDHRQVLEYVSLARIMLSTNSVSSLVGLPHVRERLTHKKCNPIER